MSQDETAVAEVVESTNQNSPTDEQSTDDFIKAFENPDGVETDSDQETEVESTDDTEQSNGADETPSEPVNPKSENRYQKMANDNRELRRQIEELEARQAQFANEQGLLNEINPDTGDYYTPQEIERLSWQQSREAEAQRTSQELRNLQIQQNQGQIAHEASTVVQEFSILNPESNDFNPTIAQTFDDLLADNLQFIASDGNTYSGSFLKANGIDPATQATLVGANISPYKLAKSIADAYNGAKSQGAVIGQAEAQKATAKMMNNVDVGSRSSAATSKDETEDFIKGFFN